MCLGSAKLCGTASEGFTIRQHRLRSSLTARKLSRGFSEIKHIFLWNALRKDNLALSHSNSRHTET